MEDTNLITLDSECLEDVISFTYLDRIIDEQGGSDADVNAKIGIEEHMALSTTTFNQHQSIELKHGEQLQPSSIRYKYL
ncbi:unnamed protein product [Schistosoma curassoni]|uniref:Uncharacterized protein n=1 Tax=Schistosoma curassoni TaxID=6186 RepID=A0A183JC69_9TREM|nr:unnamed protein product [Schistosoma curassoni]